MLMPSDPFDPNTWQTSKHEFRIYGDNNAQTWAIVDEDDYHWAIKWRWNWKTSPCGKKYLRRAVSENAHGMRLCTRSVYLHIEIMRRIKLPPSLFHRVADHRNGDSTNNRRKNLRWATYSMNNKNTFGTHSHELVE